MVTVAFSLVVLWKPSWPGLMADRTQLVAVVASAIVGLTFVACWLPMRLGMRHLEQAEF